MVYLWCMSPPTIDVDDEAMPASPQVLSISAITLATRDMAQAVHFYTALGFKMKYGGQTHSFTSFEFGTNYLNLMAQPAEHTWAWWGRTIFHVADVDAFYAHALAQGLAPDTQPRDAVWGERYFHITDPDGHELSFAQPLS